MINHNYFLLFDQLLSSVNPWRSIYYLCVLSASYSKMKIVLISTAFRAAGLIGFDAMKLAKAADIASIKTKGDSH